MAFFITKIWEVLKVDKIGQNDAFSKLNESQQNAVKLLFENELTDVEIAKNVHRSRSTLSKWKSDPNFKKAQQEYINLVIKNDLKSKAVSRLSFLMENGESDNVQLQAANSILKLAGMYDNSDDPEIKEAQLKVIKANAIKAQAEAEVARAEASRLQTATDSSREKMDKLTSDDLRKLAHIGDDADET